MPDRLRLFSWRFVASAVFVLLLAGGAEAQDRDTGDMSFERVRSTDPACAPACPEWIAAQGKITANSASRLERFIASAKRRGLPIIVNSSGGNARAAQTMGRLIRARELDVGVARTDYPSCRPDDPTCKPLAATGGAYAGKLDLRGAKCLSECLLLLAGGTRRLTGPYTQVGIAVGVGPAPSKGDGVAGGKRRFAALGRLGAYFDKMGIDPQLAEDLANAPPGRLRELSAQQQISLRLTTGQSPATDLVATARCRTFPAARNCRLITVDDVAEAEK